MDVGSVIVRGGRDEQWRHERFRATDYTDTMSSNYTTVSFKPEHKSTVDDAQDALADELGFKPSKGETVVHLCKDFVEGTD